MEQKEKVLQAIRKRYLGQICLLTPPRPEYYLAQGTNLFAIITNIEYAVGYGAEGEVRLVITCHSDFAYRDEIRVWFGKIYHILKTYFGVKSFIKFRHPNQERWLVPQTSTVGFYSTTIEENTASSTTLQYYELSTSCSTTNFYL
jgi:hypothetical protein